MPDRDSLARRLMAEALDSAPDQLAAAIALLSAGAALLVREGGASAATDALRSIVAGFERAVTPPTDIQ